MGLGQHALVSSSRRTQRLLVLFRMEGAISLVGLASCDDGFEVLFLAECSLRDRLTWTELPWMSTHERAEVESIMAEYHRLGERL